MTEQRWDDVGSETTALAVHMAHMATPVIEAGIRASLQRAEGESHRLLQQENNERIQREIQLSVDRIQWMHACDPHWLVHARTTELGRSWSAAATWAHHDSTAAAAQQRIESQLKYRDLPAMTEYERLRDHGVPAGEAMHRCAHLFTAKDVPDRSPFPTSTAAQRKPRSASEIAAEGFPKSAAEAVTENAARSIPKPAVPPSGPRTQPTVHR